MIVIKFTRTDQEIFTNPHPRNPLLQLRGITAKAEAKNTILTRKHQREGKTLIQKMTKLLSKAHNKNNLTVKTKITMHSNNLIIAVMNYYQNKSLLGSLIILNTKNPVNVNLPRVQIPIIPQPQELIPTLIIHLLVLNLHRHPHNLLDLKSKNPQLLKFPILLPKNKYVNSLMSLHKTNPSTHSFASNYQILTNLTILTICK